MRTFIDAQHMFFVATAPTDGGRVNMSPKGLESFAILDDHRVAYLDLTGSGAETIAHLRQNGRITFMFCAFDGKPNIVRLYGTGRVAWPGSDEFAAMAEHVPVQHGTRSIIVADIDRTSSSCGFAVPFYDFVSDRSQLDEWKDNRSQAELEAYWVEKNSVSIDGLPALAD